MQKFTNHVDHVARERMAGTTINSRFVLGDIDHADGLIPFGAA